MKERSKKNLCDKRNASGNILDLAVIEKIKQLADEKSDVVKQLEKSRMFHTGNREPYEQKISVMKKEKADLEKKVSSLIDTLAELNDNSAKKSIVARINEMNTQADKISQDIDQMIRLTAEHALGDIDFDSLRQMLSVCKNTIDGMSCEQKRAAMQSLVRRVVWDGENAHVVLFGSSDGDIERLAITPYVKQNETDTDDGGDFRLQTKTDWGEDSK
jgi:site-specific DNA recombinase